MVAHILHGRLLNTRFTNIWAYIVCPKISGVISAVIRNQNSLLGD